MEATISVQKIWPANPGKKYGAVLDTNNKRYLVAAKAVKRFQQGATYTITYKEESWTESPIIVSVRPQQNAQSQPGSSGGLPPILSNCLAAAISNGVPYTELPNWALAVRNSIDAFATGAVRPSSKQQTQQDLDDSIDDIYPEPDPFTP